jgi:hypothetical protein
VDLSEHRARLRGDEIRLTPTEFRLLAYLVEHAGQLVTHRQVLGAVWGAGYDRDVHLLRMTIRNLRLKLDAAILEARFDDNVGAIVITGKVEKFFSAGADINMLSSKTLGFKNNFALHGHEVLMRLENTPKIIIAAINGHAVGGGLEIAMACDIRIAKKEGGRVGLAEINLGVMPGMGGTQRLPRLGGGLAEPEEPRQQEAPHQPAEEDAPLHDRSLRSRLETGQAEADPPVGAVQLALHAEDALLLLQDLPVE